MNYFRLRVSSRLRRFVFFLSVLVLSPCVRPVVITDFFSKPDPDLGDHNPKICDFEISFELIQGNKYLENRHQFRDF